MSDPKSSDSPQVKFIHEWVEAIRTGDLNHLAKSLSEDLRNTTYPRSLGKPDQTKKEYLEYLAAIFNLWTERDVSYISCYWAPSLPWLSPSRSRPSIPSHTPQARLSFTFVSLVFGSTLHLPNLVPYPTGHLHGENFTRGRDSPRIDLHQTHCHRRRGEPEDQPGRRVYRL